ncbi:sigma factor-like helix-turn-helix DNA-binding protein [Streptomyces acidiscabies]|uniref:sigma factor-like helix-turn-helix DNA-binding protein n=1 Tax=Streptomyces acidiscabies TaxID=42234 RepID=UPI0038F5F7C3
MREFEAFVAGAGGRLLWTATLITGEVADDNPRARRLLALALARTYASWDRVQDSDPYDHARGELATRFAHSAWRHHATHPGSPLARLTPQERLILVLRHHEGVAEEQIAALLGLSPERARAICHRATTNLLHPPRGPAPVVGGAKAVPS